MDFWPKRSAIQLSIRAALSAAISVSVAELLRLQYPIYALISAVIVSDLSPTRTRQLGLWRLAGSVVGATVGASMSQFLPFSPWAIGLGVLVAMFLSYALRLQDAARVAGYVCGIVMLDYAVDPWPYAFYRLVETALGIGVAMLVSFIPRLGAAGK